MTIEDIGVLSAMVATGAAGLWKIASLIASNATRIAKVETKVDILWRSQINRGRGELLRNEWGKETSDE